MFVEVGALAIIPALVLLFLVGVVYLFRPTMYYLIGILGYGIGIPLCVLWWIVGNAFEQAQKLYRMVFRSSSKNSIAKP